MGGPESVAKKSKEGSSSLPWLAPHTYETLRLLGKGTFGQVYLCKIIETQEHVAIKSMQNFPQKDREIQVLKELFGHPNIVELKGAFKMGPAPPSNAETLNLVFEYLSDTLHRVIKHYNRTGRQMEALYAKLYTYQIMRGVNYMHIHGIAHCDLKPQNCLFDGKSHTLKLCDFGTAKRFNFQEPRPLYICSRYFRAPEIIFGSATYTCSIDLWAAGCIFAEMILGQPLFTGKTGIDQCVEMMKVLGTPSNAELRAMNPNYPKGYNFSINMPKLSWETVLSKKGEKICTEDACDLVDQLVRYDPADRLPPMCCLMHRYFDSLREKELNNMTTPLFDFLPNELVFCISSEREKLVPGWYTAKQEKIKKEEVKVEPGATPGTRTPTVSGSPK